MIVGMPDISNADIEKLSTSMKLNFSDDTRKNILKSRTSIDVQACPGSGKTTLVAAKLILLSKNWPFKHRGICALSHTNVAKDEIIGILQKSQVPEALSLLRYPHFIGTIQEFVNRHLALPFLRSEGHLNITVDNDEYFEAGLWRLGHTNYFSNRIRGSFSDVGKQRGFLNKTHMVFDDGRLSVNFDALPQRWRGQNNYERARNNLTHFKHRLSQQNLFLFRDMYSYAQQALHSVPNLSNAISIRFPILFIDEMQDTQQFQDALLQTAFGIEQPFGSTVQRFGDPDQAIFNGVNGEQPNETFNTKTRDQMSFILDGSHRYQQDIADKIRPFSLNEIALGSEIPTDIVLERTRFHHKGGPFRHTIFVFDDHSQERVVEAFCKLVSVEFSDDRFRNAGLVVKVVGAVGADIDPDQGQLRMGHYWPRFKKTKAVSKPVFETLIETIRYSRGGMLGDAKNAFRLILAGLLKFLDLLNERDADGLKYRGSTLRSYLESKAQWQPFCSLIFVFLSSDFDDSPGGWANYQEKLGQLFDLNNLGHAARLFFNYVVSEVPEQEEELVVGSMRPLEDNSLVYDNTFRVALSTIHGVKGETHDATLVLESKNRAHDVGGMIRHLSGEHPNQENRNHDLRDNPHHTAGNAASKKFLRQLFVAMSRPRHLLCIAIHNDRLSQDNRAALVENGWSIVDILD